MKAKKDYMEPQKLNQMLIQLYRGGRTVKSLKKEFAMVTVFEGGDKPLPKGYVENVIFEHVKQDGI